jgi:hypothetical protein
MTGKISRAPRSGSAGEASIAREAALIRENPEIATRRKLSPRSLVSPAVKHGEECIPKPCPSIRFERKQLQAACPEALKAGIWTSGLEDAEAKRWLVTVRGYH